MHYVYKYTDSFLLTFLLDKQKTKLVWPRVYNKGRVERRIYQMCAESHALGMWSSINHNTTFWCLCSRLMRETLTYAPISIVCPGKGGFVPPLGEATPNKFPNQPPPLPRTNT